MSGSFYVFITIVHYQKKKRKNNYLKLDESITVADPGFLNGGVADMTEQYQNNLRQSGLRDSFAHFLNFKLK